ncbi:class I SAM-dependent methyltransferase [Candidatus Bathyarchaeota archaeon]|jgi:SAM-dependent methyltransferase|nr:class I SAM-dependent methyltransferase [Candidatus Bathyarchaeota archaeon]
MQPDQDQKFATSEGNNWFQRNEGAIGRFDPESDVPLKLIELYELRPHSVLEIGAANGYRLAAIKERVGARVVAVEPSVQAIRDGKTKFPTVEFVRGQCMAIPLKETFGLVIVNFVLHWIDRSNLLRSVAEIDRLLEDGGFLIIGDFSPTNLVKVRYHHLPEEQVYTYKQNYSTVFLASGLYHVISVTTGHHWVNTGAEASEEDRVGTWLLRKMLKEHYVEGVRGT